MSKSKLKEFLSDTSDTEVEEIPDTESEESETVKPCDNQGFSIDESLQNIILDQSLKYANVANLIGVFLAKTFLNDINKSFNKSVMEQAKTHSIAFSEFAIEEARKRLEMQDSLRENRQHILPSEVVVNGNNS